MATAERRRQTDRANLYDYLQVIPRADAGVIHAAYRALARQYHPDVNSSGQASRMMREINAAYHVLGDPNRRARYDAHRARMPIPMRRRPTSAASNVTVMPSAPARPPIARTQSGTRQVVAALVFSLMIVGALVLALVLVVTSLDDRPPNAVGTPLSLLEVRGGGSWASALDRR
jgi:curved DNA-binding protein CbpA